MSEGEGPPQAESSAGRVPPHDLDAEAAVLSAVLLGHTKDNGEAGEHRVLIEHVLTSLESERFYSDANGRIWEAMREVAAAGQPIDIVTVSSYLRDRDRLAQVGGPSYIAQLADATPAVAHIEAHAQIVTRKWRMRAAIAAAQRFAAEGYGDVGDEDAFIEGGMLALSDLNDLRPAKTEAALIADAVKKVADRVRNIGQGPSYGLLTGFTELDRLTGGFTDTQVTLLGAPPKTGKTTFARAITTNIAGVPEVISDKISIGRGVIWISLEMSAEEQALCWACTIARVDLKRVEANEATADELDELWRALEWLKTLPIVIFGRRSIRVKDLKRLMHEAKQELLKKGARPRLLVIDHLQLLFKNEPKDPGRNEASIYGDITREITSIAEEWARIPVLLITQLTEDDKGRMKARGSRDIEADCHNFWILEVFDDKPAPTFPAGRSTSPVESHLTVKFQRKGPKGSSTLWFTPAYTEFSETVYGGSR